MTIKHLVQLAHGNAKAKGFYDSVIRLQGLVQGDAELELALENTLFAQRIALAQSELSEALESDRKRKTADLSLFDFHLGNGEIFEEAFESVVKDTIEDELADSVIRIADLAGFLNIDLQRHVELKMQYNATRPHKHGKSY